MEFVQVEIGPNFPVILLCFSDGTIAFHPQGQFPLYVEVLTTGVSSMFDSECFSLKGEGEEDFQDYEYSYPYPYKEMPTLKAWLVQQNLESPIPIKGKEGGSNE